MITDPLTLQVAAQIVHAGLGAARAVLSRLCLPAAQSLGLLAQDTVDGWRANNFISVMQKVEKKLVENKVPEGCHAHPRVVHAIVESSSWIEDSAVQDMWAGLLASSCTESGDDDSNLIFTNLLGNLTKLQARMLKYACESAEKRVSPEGLISAQVSDMNLEKLQKITEENDIQRLDRELDCLRSAGLIEGGIAVWGGLVDLTPSSLALHMYVRCHGSRLSPVEFFKIEPPSASAPATQS
jgi:hypothetical protein